MIISFSGKIGSGKFIWRYTKKERIEITNNVKLKIKRVC